MRNLTPAMTAALSGGATTLARCWTLIRRDGTTLGFTDHDRDLAFGGVTYVARTGVEGSQATSELGFATGGSEIAGALSADGLAEADLARGLWDDARVETWLVDWSDVSTRTLLGVGFVGEIRRADTAFTAELRDLGHRFDEERGRVYGSSCSADLGDARCGVALAGAAYMIVATVSATDGASTLQAAAASGFAPGWFENGRLTFLTGANMGAIVEIRSHAGPSIGLWRALPFPISIGDTVRIQAGCDKRFATCRTKFANGANFRGFPHIPGNDHLIAIARRGDAQMDGGSLFT